MDLPTATEIRSRSELLTDAYPTGDPGDGALDALALDAAATISMLTCRSLVEGHPGEAVPTWLEETARMAIVLKIEQLHAARPSARIALRRIRGRGLRSFTAGRYSESYFGPEEAAKARMLDADPLIHERLWALATEECREAWMALWTGEHAPAAAVAVFDWGARSARRVW